MKINTGSTRIIRMITAALAAVLIIVALFWVSKSVYTKSTYFIPNEQYVQLEDGVPVEQAIRIEGDHQILKSVYVLFATNARVNEGEVRIELLDGGNVLCEWNIKASELLDNAIREFNAKDGIRLENGKSYTVRITDSFEGENQIAVGQASTGFLSCQIRSYDSVRGLKWFVLMSIVFIAGYAVLCLFGGLLECSVPKIAVLGVAGLLVLFILEFDYFPKVRTNLSVRPVPSDTSIISTLEPGVTGEYTFSYEGDPIDAISFFTSGENGSEYLVTLVNNTTGTTYCRDYAVTPDRRVANGRLCMLIKTSDTTSGLRYFEEGQYDLTITNTSADKNLNIELSKEIEEDGIGEVTFSGTRETALGTKLASLTVAMMFLYIVLISVFRKRWELTVERFYLITVIPLSLIFLVVMQPWNVPDCGAHFLASYRVSNLMLGIHGDREWFIRACDAAYYNGNSWWTERLPDLEGISSMIEGLREGAGDVTLYDLVPHEDKMKYYSVINWLPQAIGLSIGRILGLGAEATVLLGRLFILAAFIAGSWRAIRNAACGKSVFAALSLLPVSLMMSSSYSYDCMVIIVCLNFVAIFLKLRKEITRAGLIEALVWAFLLGAVKGGGCLILLPVMLLLLRKDRKAVLTSAGIISAALVSVLIFNKILPSDELFQFGEENSGNMMTAFAFSNPAQYLRMVISSYHYYIDDYLAQAIGQYLSYIEDTVPFVAVLMALLSMLVFSTFEKDELELSKSDRTLFVLLVVLAALITPAMLLSYTPSGSGVIYGIQGRYFFSVMPLLLLAITKSGLKRSGTGADEVSVKASMNTCINVYMIFTLITVFMITRTYLAR